MTTPTLLCLAPAPAIDRTAHVERIRHDEVLRPTELVVKAGGKGVNVARAALVLGADVITSGVVGGHTGRWFVEELEREGLGPRFATCVAEMRTAYVTVDRAGTSVIVYERPPPASVDEYEAFLALLAEELLPACDRAVVAGSIPAGLGDDAFSRMVTTAREAGRPLLVDVSGPGLSSALAAGPDIVKIGRVEAVESGLVEPDEDGQAAATALVDAGAALAIVTDGADAVFGADSATTWSADVPRIEAVNPVGSGDAFDAALSIALAGGADVPDAIAEGIAAGAANALTLSAGDLDASEVRTLRTRVTVAAEGR